MWVLYWVLVICWKILLWSFYLVVVGVALVGVAVVAAWRATVGLAKLLAGLYRGMTGKTPLEGPEGQITAKPGPRDYNLPE